MFVCMYVSMYLFIDIISIYIYIHMVYQDAINQYMVPYINQQGYIVLSSSEALMRASPQECKVAMENLLSKVVVDC